MHTVIIHRYGYGQQAGGYQQQQWNQGGQGM